VEQVRERHRLEVPVACGPPQAELISDEAGQVLDAQRIVARDADLQDRPLPGEDMEAPGVDHALSVDP
jgi:hypothetical protein